MLVAGGDAYLSEGPDDECEEQVDQHPRVEQDEHEEHDGHQTGHLLHLLELELACR